MLSAMNIDLWTNAHTAVISMVFCTLATSAVTLAINYTKKLLVYYVKTRVVDGGMSFDVRTAFANLALGLRTCV